MTNQNQSKPRVIVIKGTVSDKLTATLHHGVENLGREYSGHVLVETGLGAGGDSLELHINVDTGQIMNWTPLSDERLAELFQIEKAA